MNKLFLFCLSLLFVAKSEAQLLGKVEDLKLSRISGKSVQSFYSNGYLTKAQGLQTMLDNSVSYFRQKLQIKIDSLYLTVFDEVDFAKLNIQKPYGLPFVDGVPAIVFLPANSSGVVASQTKNLLTSQKGQSEILLKSGYSLEIAIDKAVDMIGLHEVGHLYSVKLNIQSNLGSVFWMKEFVASYLAYSYLKDNDPKSAQLWALMSHAIVNSWLPENQRLEEMGVKGIGNPQLYSWYQAKIITLVAQVYDAQKLSFISELQSFCSKNKGITKEQLLSELSKKIKDVERW